MKLYMSANSPYARKVRILVRLLGLEERITEVPTNVRDGSSGFWAINPVGKIPTLAFEDGGVIAESNLIAVMLDRTFGGGDLVGPVLSDASRAGLLGLADGLVDRGMAARLEMMQEHPDQDFIERQLDAAARSADALDAAVDPDRSRVDYADIASVTARDWIALRHQWLEIDTRCPRLARFADARADDPAFSSTRPTG